MICRICKTIFKPQKHNIKKHDYICKACQRDYNKQYAIRRKKEGKPVSGSKTWNPEKKKAWKEKYYSDPKVKKRLSESQKRYRNDPILRMKHEARWQSNKAVQNGKIKKKPCEVCAMKAEMHHDDYYKPLEVRWFCKEHHVMLHAKAKG